MTEDHATPVPSIATSSPIYGPVRSWRLGSSLGVDLLLKNSICSFKCIYCQLGKINIHTATRRVFVSTEQVMRDIKLSVWSEVDVITFSGSGEPTLALNLGEVIDQVKRLTGKPIVVLTNAAHLNDPQVRGDLGKADKVFCKLDATDERTFRMINRPVVGITLEGVIAGLKLFRAEYPGHLAIQIMLQKLHKKQVGQFAKLLLEIQPDEVQLNRPSRSIPQGWQPEARGNHQHTPYPAVPTKPISPSEVAEIEVELKALTGLNFVSSAFLTAN